jgi:hypothetical protein
MRIKLLITAFVLSLCLYVQGQGTSGGDYRHKYAKSVAYSNKLEIGAVSTRKVIAVKSIIGYNSGPAQWVQVHNTAAIPANTAVPIYTFRVNADANFSFDLSVTGAEELATGLTVCNSTTGPTLTAGASDCWFNVVYQSY